MSKRINSSKRLQIIQRWLNGIDDEDYEVFPTKTEGKYFVRPRKNKLKQDSDPNNEPDDPTQFESANDPTNEPDDPIQFESASDPTNEQTEDPTLLGSANDPNNDPLQEESCKASQTTDPTVLVSANDQTTNNKTQKQHNAKSIIKSKPQRVQSIKPKRSITNTMNQRQNNPAYDPTINIEILNQLKLLGEELKTKREKKEQKQLIKQVVQKQFSKQAQAQAGTYQPEAFYQPDNEQEPDNEPSQGNQQPPQPIRRRNNVFSDLM